MTITYSIIQKSQLEGAHRLDAEYYQPEYLNVIHKLKKQGSARMANLSKTVVCGPFGSTILADTYTSGGTTVVRPFNLDGFNANLGDLVTIPREDVLSKSLKSFHNGDIFFARVGDVTTGIAHGFDGEVTVSPNIIAAKLKRGEINPYFLIAFLNTKYGVLQLERDQRTVAQPTISTHAVKNLLIPIVDSEFQEQISSLVLRAFNRIEESKVLYSQAENLLLDELGLKDFKIKDDLSYIVNLSEIKSSHRADAEYFQPKYDKLVERIKNKNAKTLGELVSMKKGIEPGAEAYQDEGRLFIRVSSLSKYGVEDKDQKYLSEELYQKLKNNHEPKVGEILLTKDATPGITSVVKGRIEGIISSGVLRLKLRDKEIENEYLTLCLNSLVGQMQAERDGGGSIITHWRPEQVKRVLIPVLPKSTQQKVAEFVQKSHEARSKAKQLLEQAKQRVEGLIEG